MKPFIRLVVVCFLVCLLSGSLSAFPQPFQHTGYLGFDPFTGQNSYEYNIVFQFPDPNRFGPGPYPLFVWVPGTFEWYLDGGAFTFMTAMSSRGFVAASVEYHNTNFIQLCPDYMARAKGVFEATRSTSAVGVLCRLKGVDCGKGIVSTGISQGGALAILAKNYAPNVNAVYAISISDLNKNGNFSLECLDDQNTALPSNRLTVVNGENDEIFGGQVPIMNVSGVTCPIGTFQCWSGDGSGAGWYMVKGTQVEDGNADHCYMIVGNCTVEASRVDKYWYYEAKFNWSLKPNVDWLATFGTGRVFSANGQ